MALGNQIDEIKKAPVSTIPSEASLMPPPRKVVKRSRQEMEDGEADVEEDDAKGEAEMADVDGKDDKDEELARLEAERDGDNVGHVASDDENQCRLSLCCIVLASLTKKLETSHNIFCTIMLRTILLGMVVRFLG